jgi:toxin ParE1/3/4
MEVIWTRESLERLEDIQYYLAVQENAPQAARNTLEKILAREAQIRESPLSGRIVPDYNHSNLREVLEGSYRIIYSIQSDRILIVSVMHQRRLLSRVKELKAAANVALKKD